MKEERGQAGTQALSSGRTNYFQVAPDGTTSLWPLCHYVPGGMTTHFGGQQTASLLSRVSGPRSPNAHNDKKQEEKGVIIQVALTSSASVERPDTAETGRKATGHCR